VVFDTAAGKQEILSAASAANEVSAIHVSRELAAAQKEYFSEQHGEYAHRIYSEAGKHRRSLLENRRERTAKSHRSAGGPSRLGRDTKTGRHAQSLRGYYFHT